MADEDPSRKPTALLVRLLRRVLLDCTLDELSERSGIHPDLLSRYEQGKVLRATRRNLERLLRAAGVLEIRQPLLLAIDQLSEALSPRPPAAASADDPRRLCDLLERTSRRLLLLQSEAGEPAPPPRIHRVALLVRFCRKALLGCSRSELSHRTGIHENLLARYEAGQVERPSPGNLDRILGAAGVLHLGEPFLQAIDDLAAVLARRSGGNADKPKTLLDPGQADAFLAFSVELLRRTREELGLLEE